MKWWERNGWLDEGVEVKGLGIGEGVVRARVGSAVFGPCDPSSPIHFWQKFGVNPIGELHGAFWILGCVMVKPW